MDSTTLGLTVLGGDTRVRTNGQLIRLDQLSTTGPAGPQGPIGATGATGPAGPAGEDGADGQDGTSINVSNYYNKQQVNFVFATTPPTIYSALTPGAKVWDDTTNLTRAIKGQTRQPNVYLHESDRPTGPTKQHVGDHRCRSTRW